MGQGYALVTAGARGLGRAIVCHLARRHYVVCIHYYSSHQAAMALQADIVAAGGQAVLLQADLSRSDERERLLRGLMDVTSELHVLVNNLGWYLLERLPHITIEQWERSFTLNCTATFHLIQLTLPLLKAARPPGRIINLGDAACDRITAHILATPYHIAKLGVHVLTRSYAQLLMSKGITVNMISPGFLEHSIGKPPKRLPAKRPGHFEDVMGALDYLLSEQACYVSGTNLLVSGAWNLG